MPLVTNAKHIYKCPKCSTFIANGDRYCRGCGHQFSANDVEQMRRLDSMTMKRVFEIALVISVLIGFLYVLVKLV